MVLLEILIWTIVRSIVISIKLVLDNIRSCHNVGSILRSADAFGVTSVIYYGTTPYPSLENDDRLPHLRKKQTTSIAKTALGAEKTVPGVHVSDITQLKKILKGSKVISLEQSSTSKPLESFKTIEPIVLILGNEVDGVSPQLLELSSDVIEIPMLGIKESLNVSVATGIALYVISSSA